MIKHKVYNSIVKAVNSKRLIESFASRDFCCACPGFASATYNTFLSKHRKGNPSRTSELFERIDRGSFKLIRPFKYGLPV